jgi:hypothetical protein
VDGVPTGSLLDTLVEVLGEHVREALLQQLHANDIPTETTEVEVQTDVADEGGAEHDSGGSKDKASKPAKKRKPLYPGAGNAKAMAYDSGASECDWSLRFVRVCACACVKSCPRHNGSRL